MRRSDGGAAAATVGVPVACEMATVAFEKLQLSL